MKRICVFCGAAEGARPAYAEAARRFGVELVRRGLGLVYGGCAIGMMGILADTPAELLDSFEAWRATQTLRA